MEKGKIEEIAFTLVEKVNVKRVQMIERQKMAGSLNELPVEDWTDKIIKSEYSFCEVFEEEIGENKIILQKEGEEYSLPNKEYKLFLEMVDFLSKEMPFKIKASNNYLVSNCLVWVVDVFKKNRAEKTLIDFLLDKLEIDAKKRVYYFQILNLSIDKQFKIGEVEFVFFTKKFFDDFWATYKESGYWDKDSFDKILRKYQGKVLASYTVEAEPKMGEQISYLKACEAVDVIKLFSDTLAKPNLRCYVDLEKRLNINFSSETLSKPINTKYEFSITSKANNSPFNISSERLELLESFPLPIFSSFLAKKNKTEFDRLVKNSISLFASSLALEDLHIRVLQMIMILESLFLRENEERKMTKKVKERLSRFRFPNNLESRLHCQQILSVMYPIRHKMVHKAKRLYIGMSEMANFQRIMFETLMDLIKVNDKYITKDLFLDSLN